MGLRNSGDPARIDALESQCPKSNSPTGREKARSTEPRSALSDRGSALKKTVENRKRKWVYWGLRNAKKEIPLRISVLLFSEFRMMTWLANPSLERER